MPHKSNKKDKIILLPDLYFLSIGCYNIADNSKTRNIVADGVNEWMQNMNRRTYHTALSMYLASISHKIQFSTAQGCTYENVLCNESFNIFNVPMYEMNCSLEKKFKYAVQNVYLEMNETENK